MPQYRLSHRILTATTALLIGLSGTTASAIDGTSGSTPDSIESCALHEAAPAQASTPSASPVAVIPEASPIASPVIMEASPAASPVLEETNAPDPARDDLMAAAGSILTCMSENNVEILTVITSPEFRGTWLGVGMTLDDATFASILPMMPKLPYGLVDITSIEVDGATANITVVYSVGKQVLTADWTMSLAEIGSTQVWRVDTSTARATEVPADAPTLEVTIQDGSFRFAPDKAAGTEVVLKVTNSGENVHEILIMRTPSTMTVADIVASPTGIPEGTTFIAQATVPAGESGTIVLAELRPGTYTVVDLLPDASGMPNASNGMFTTFRITE